ncbi:MAG: hypothetical protein N2556_05325, partial [Anaerolineae bacterium]|nr:hypothetical protein [Anaerolineae bacterium]
AAALEQTSAAGEEVRALSQQNSEHAQTAAEVVAASGRKFAEANQALDGAVQAMAELGIDISGQRSKSVEEFRGQSFDVVITVCDRAAQECPVWLGPGRAIHMGFPDPAQADGITADRLDAFRQVRDGIREKVLGYLETEATEPLRKPQDFYL